MLTASKWLLNPPEIQPVLLLKILYIHSFEYDKTYTYIFGSIIDIGTVLLRMIDNIHGSTTQFFSKFRFLKLIKIDDVNYNNLPCCLNQYILFCYSSPSLLVFLPNFWILPCEEWSAFSYWQYLFHTFSSNQIYQNLVNIIKNKTPWNKINFNYHCFWLQSIINKSSPLFFRDPWWMVFNIILPTTFNFIQLLE